MEKIVTDRTELLALLDSYEKVNSDCDHSKYLSWANQDTIQTDYFKKISEVKNPYNSNSQTNYWGEGAPVELEKYPYFFCEIHKCEKCNTLFFHYPEDGGHGTQLRYRIIRSELLIDNSKEKYFNLAMPYSLEDFFKSFQQELIPTDTISKSWDGLWEALMQSKTLPYKFILYNYNVFETNYKQEASNLKEISKRFNKLSTGKKLIIKADNIYYE